MKPLVSVVIVSYNSSEFVIETLESVRKQNYAPIELILSDDCSKDNTVALCEEWGKENRKYFSDFQIIKSDHNTGIPANCNRGIKASSGEWIKLIAADDLLSEDCINENLKFAQNNPEISAIHSQSSYYKDMFCEENFMYNNNAEAEFFNHKSITAEQQFRILLQGCHVNTPTVILKKEIYKKYGYFDESFKTVEDWPMWIKLAKKGIKFHYLSKVTVKYRVHAASITNAGRDEDLFTKQQLREIEVYEKYIVHELSPVRRFFDNAEHSRIKVLMMLGFRKRKFLPKSINFITFKMLNFFRQKVRNAELQKLQQ